MSLSTRWKLVALCLSLLTLCALTLAQAGWSFAAIARVGLGVGSVVGLAWWSTRSGSPASFKAAPRLVVVQRVGLSARTGLALVEVDGRPFVVVHGDGFARLRPAPRRVPLPKAVTP
jgi:flagellar biogenesis protein FliO